MTTYRPPPQNFPLAVPLFQSFRGGWSGVDQDTFNVG